MSNKQPLLSLLVFLFGLILSTSSVGCNSAASADRGDADVVIRRGQALELSATVVRVTLTVTGPGISPAIVNDLAAAEGGWRGSVLGMPAGEGRTFHADAFDGNSAVVYRGEVTPVTITRGATAVVAIVLQQLTPPPLFANNAPVIDGIIASAKSVDPEATASLQVFAHDPDSADTLTYAWSATDGSFGSSAAETTTWTAPATEETVTITIEVTDPSGAKAAMNFDLDVLARGSADVRITFNTWPVISSVSANPPRVDVGESTTLNVVAADADGDTLTYEWSASCDGTLSDATVRAPTFMLTSLPGDGRCTLSVVVRDGMGGQTSGSVGIACGPAAPISFAPVVDDAFRSSASATAADVVVFRVRAHAPNGAPLTFTWTAAGGVGTFGSPTSTDGESEVTWTAPTPFTANADITVTISDGGEGLSTQQMFSVSAPFLACTNCSFETGDLTGWTVTDTVGASVRVQSGGADGAYALHHRFDGHAGTIELGQDMTITGPTLAFDYTAWWDVWGLPRTFSVRIEPAGGGAPLAETNVLTANSSTSSASGPGQVDVSAYEGELHRIVFVWTIPETYTGPGDFLLDHIRFEEPAH